MSNYQNLLAQREELDKAIAQAKALETSNAISQAKTIIADFGLKVDDVFPTQRTPEKAARKSGKKVEAKYRDASTGLSWTGRGKEPRWIAGKDRTQFLIESSSTV